MIDTKELRSMVNGAQFESFANSVINSLLDRIEAAEKERDVLRASLALESQENGALRDSVDRACEERDALRAELDAPKQALIERLEKAVKEWRDRCTNLLDFIEHAPVGSGVCCCGEDMENHVSSDHSPVDQWSWSVHHWSREIETALKNTEDA